MKKSDKIALQLAERPQIIRQRDVIKAVQSEGIFRRLVAGGWLVPCVAEKKYKAFRRADVDAAVARILAGEMPPQLPVKEKAAV